MKKSEYNCYTWIVRARQLKVIPIVLTAKCLLHHWCQSSGLHTHHILWKCLDKVECGFRIRHRVSCCANLDSQLYWTALWYAKAARHHTIERLNTHRLFKALRQKCLLPCLSWMCALRLAVHSLQQTQRCLYCQGCCDEWPCFLSSSMPCLLHPRSESQQHHLNTCRPLSRCSFHHTSGAWPLVIE